ncbi:hypothetical protein B6D60_12050 [candidate division KSB1 bacterium 4484_87]|nr:MAG: hypothetical protein B6D60_12050 [candidate division KSB1 bacterium 4484_87]
MGQQQLLLIVLAVILVGVAVVVGINMFSANAASANVDYLVNDLLKLAAKAQQYYLKPVSMGGGGGSFRNLTIDDLTTQPSNENGTYQVRRARRNRVILRGDGKLDGDGDGRKSRVRAVVFPDSIYIDIRRR